MKENNKIIIIKTISKDIKSVFDFFIDNKKISTWLCEQADINPMEGGNFHLFWDKLKSSKENTLGCKFLEFTYQKKLRFNWKGIPRFSKTMNKIGNLTEVEVLFESEGIDKTKITLIHSGWGENLKWIKAKKWYEIGWENALDVLNEVINKKESLKF